MSSEVNSQILIFSLAIFSELSSDLHISFTRRLGNIHSEVNSVFDESYEPYLALDFFLNQIQFLTFLLNQVQFLTTLLKTSTKFSF